MFVHVVRAIVNATKSIHNAPSECIYKYYKHTHTHSSLIHEIDDHVLESEGNYWLDIASLLNSYLKRIILISADLFN